MIIFVSIAFRFIYWAGPLREKRRDLRFSFQGPTGGKELRGRECSQALVAKKNELDYGTRMTYDAPDSIPGSLGKKLAMDLLH